MHVKESVKEFVHDVKRRFSHHKHKRDGSSTYTESVDGASSYSTADSHPDTPEHSNPGSPASSQPGTPERRRLSSFIRPRTPSTPSKKHHHNVLHKARRLDGKRSRLFSAPSLPHEHVSHSSQEQDADAAQPGERDGESTHQVIETGAQGSVDRASSVQDASQCRTPGHSQEDYTDVIDISARMIPAVPVVPVGERVRSMDATQQTAHNDADDVDRDSLSWTQPQSDSDTRSDISGTLITAASGPDHKKSVSESDSDLHSDQVVDPLPRFVVPDSPVDIVLTAPADTLDIDTTASPTPKPPSIVDSIPTPDPMAEDSDLPPIPPRKSEDDATAPGPDPFVLDDSEGTSSAADSKDSTVDADVASPREEEIALAQSGSSLAVPPPALNTERLERANPALLVPTQSRSTTPALPTRTTPGSPAPVYIPRLTAPSMFLPIPNTDPLSALLTKYVPPEQRPQRDVVGEYAGRDIHEMVMSNSWRALAKMARDRIVASDPEDLSRILDLWSLRLSSLARLRLTNQASAECTNLFAVLNAVPSTSVPGSFPGSGSLSPSIPLPLSPAPRTPTSLPLSPSGLGGLAQLPGTPSQKPSPLSPSIRNNIPQTTTHTHTHTYIRGQTHDIVHPFELTVFHARVHYWAGDPIGYVDALSGILGMCKERAREEGRIVVRRREMKKKRDEEREARQEAGSGSEEEEGNEGNDNEEEAEEQAEEREEGEEGEDSDEEEEEEEEEEEGEQPTEESKESTKETGDEILVTAEANLSMWLERAARVCLILASQMIEMNEYQAAINLLAPLCTRRAPPEFLPTPSPALHSALGRIYLLSGNLEKAQEHFNIVASAVDISTDGSEQVIMNTALMSSASGDWVRAEEALREVILKDPGNFTALNNLAVTLLSQGRIKEGIDLLESALKTSPSSAVVAESFLFNLSTLYELRSAAAIDKKRELLVEVAKWSGDGLRTACLKMPSS